MEHILNVQSNEVCNLKSMIAYMARRLMMASFRNCFRDPMSLRRYSETERYTRRSNDEKVGSSNVSMPTGI